MPADKTTSKDYDSLNSVSQGGGKSRDQQTLRPSGHKNEEPKKPKIESGLLRNRKTVKKPDLSSKVSIENRETSMAEDFLLQSRDELNEKKAQSKQVEDSPIDQGNKSEDELSHSEKIKQDKQKRQSTRDKNILSTDDWLIRNGHNVTYLGLYLFSFWVFFRPYELIPGLGFLSPVAFYVAFATLAIYLPSQLATEGNLTVLSTEVKCIVAIAVLALITIPIAKSPALAWETFNDNFIKAVLMFIVMVNVLRTRKRLMGLIWLSISIGLYLSIVAWTKSLKGEFSVEGTRVGLDDVFGGMFGNPNDMALHLVIMTPIVIVLGISTKNVLMKGAYFTIALFLVIGNTVTLSRGGFLGLLTVAGVLAWKLGRRYRLKVAIVTIVLGFLFILLAPGEYGQRILSIFDSALDPMGSSNQRTELLKRSIIVSIRNPWGIGIGNFPLVGFQNLGTHNAYTQISSELGIFSLFLYLIFLVSPFRKLRAIERMTMAKDRTDWFYYLSIGLQASLAGFMVSSFFGAIAYNWFVYYLIAYAVAFRRIYKIETGEEEIKSTSITEKVFGWKVKPV